MFALLEFLSERSWRWNSIKYFSTLALFEKLFWILLFLTLLFIILSNFKSHFFLIKSLFLVLELLELLFQIVQMRLNTVINLKDLSLKLMNLILYQKFTWFKIIFSINSVWAYNDIIPIYRFMFSLLQEFYQIYIYKSMNLIIILFLW